MVIIINKKLLLLFLGLFIARNSYAMQSNKKRTQIDTPEQESLPVKKHQDDVVDDNIDSDLLNALVNNNVTDVDRLLSQGGNSNGFYSLGSTTKKLTPLVTRAVRCDDLQCLRSFLANGADPNIKDKIFGHTPLGDLFRRIAAESPYYMDRIRLLLEYGADPSIANYDGRRPLHFALTKNHIQIAKIILGEDLDVEEFLKRYCRKNKKALIALFIYFKRMDRGNQKFIPKWVKIKIAKLIANEIRIHENHTLIQLAKQSSAIPENYLGVDPKMKVVLQAYDY